MSAWAKNATVTLALAVLLLSGTVAAFPHDHGSAAGSDEREQPCPESHFHRQDSPSADDCTICFFNRLAGHGQIEAAESPTVALREAPSSFAADIVPDRFLASWTEARGPPIA